MPSVPDPFRRAHLDPHLEALELRDFSARDVVAAQDADAFPHDALTDAEIDALFVLEMEQRDRAAACPAGHRDAACEACGCGLYVPVGQGAMCCVRSAGGGARSWRRGRTTTLGRLRRGRYTRTTHTSQP